MSEQQQQVPQFKASTDYIIACLVVVEGLFIAFCLVSRQTFIGYLLPVVVSIFSITITVLAIRGFFKQNR